MRRAAWAAVVILTAFNLWCNCNSRNTEGAPPVRKRGKTAEHSPAQHRATVVPARLHTLRRGLPRKRCKNPFVPRWHIGQTWRVEYTFYYRYYPLGTRAEIVEYRVVGMKQIDGRQTYDVRRFDAITGSPDEGSSYQYVDADTFTLREAEELRGVDARDLAVSRPFMDTRLGTLHSIQFDFGAFCSVVPGDGSKKMYAKARGRLSRKHGLLIAKGSIPMEVMAAGDDGAKRKTAYVQQIDFTSIKDSMKLVLMEPETCGIQRSRAGWRMAEQIWKKGKPWWSRAKRTVCGTVWAEGKLIEGKNE